MVLQKIHIFQNFSQSFQVLHSQCFHNSVTHTKELVPVTSLCNQSPVYMNELVTGTCPTNSSHEAFWGTSHMDLSQKFHLVWIHGTSHKDQSLLPVTRFWPVYNKGTCPCGLLQGLVAGTSSLVCSKLYFHRILGTLGVKEKKLVSSYHKVTKLQFATPFFLLSNDSLLQNSLYSNRNFRY